MAKIYQLVRNEREIRRKVNSWNEQKGGWKKNKKRQNRMIKKVAGS
jgi:hypothetical protein